MADNVELNAGSGGQVIRSDDDGTAHWQYVKLAYGADNTQTLVTADNGLTVQPDSGGFTVTAELSAVDNAVLDSIATNTARGTATDDAAFTPGTGTIAVVGAFADEVSPDSVNEGDAGALRMTLDRRLLVSDRSQSAYRNIDANAEAAIKASAGTLNWIHAINLTNAIAYLHLYNATTASVTPGTTTPTFTFPIPTTGTASEGAGFTIKLNHYFSTAITLVVTTTTNGATGDPGTNGVMVNAGYT